MSRQAPGWQYCGVTVSTPRTLPAAWRMATRQRAALAVVALVLLGHALLLWPALPESGRQYHGAGPLQVRQIVLPAASSLPAAAVAAAHPAARRRAAAPLLPAIAPAIAPVVAPATLAASETAPDSQPAAAPVGIAVPVYATRLPPPITLHYALKRGALSGRSVLHWQPDEASYQLSLSSQANGAAVLGSMSQGAIDAHGLAPERHTDSRRGRDLRAVNFQRDSERITFSGPRGEAPLLPGAQDRLSWMLQLPAIIDADPAAWPPGRELALFVAGTRGDAAVWSFTVIDRETTELPEGAVPATLHLRREATRPYDTQVDVWLDPARHHLPVRALLQVRPLPLVTEYLLEALSSP